MNEARRFLDPSYSLKCIYKGAADFNGDGKNDLLFRNTRNGNNIGGGSLCLFTIRATNNAL